MSCPNRRAPGLAARGAALPALLAALAGVAHAGGPPAGACTDRDLLPAAARAASRVRGDARQLVDGELLPEGADWMDAGAVVLRGGRAAVRFDLGRPASVGAVLVQADANDLYRIDGSTDGEQWRPLGTIRIIAERHGLRTRLLTLPRPREVRHLRLRAVSGDGSYSVSEFRAYCRPPSPWPPAEIAAAYRGYKFIGRTKALLTLPVLDGIKALAAALATLLLLWTVVLVRAGRPDLDLRVRNVLLISLALLAGLCWWNLFKFHFDRYVHTWEVYHYHVGSKYLPELGYKRLYDCTVIADHEAGVARGAERRLIRNLRTNALESVDAVIAAPGQRCKRHFSPARWKEFGRDIAWFRGSMSRSRWERAQQDHGFNATPVWSILGRGLSSLGGVSDGQVLALTLIDPVLLLGMWACVFWAFGWRAACVAVIFWGTNYPARFWWTGGSFLRQDWLALCVVGICLLRRRRMFGAGVALTYAGLLRVFPFLLLAGVVINAARHMWRARRLTLSAAHRRFALGGAAALVVLLPLSILAAGGPGAWGGFWSNSRKHIDTPLTNNMGLRTVVAFARDRRAQVLKDSSRDDPYARWKAGRNEVFEARRPVFFLLLAAFVLMLARGVRDQEDWVAVVMSVGLIPVAAELTCYYYAIMLCYGLLLTRSVMVAAGLCLYSAVMWLAPAVWGWYDEQFTWLSLVTLLFVGLVTWWFGGLPRPGGEPAPAVRAGES